MSLFGSALPYEDDTAASLIRQRGFPPGKTYDQMPETYMCACCSQLGRNRESDEIAWEVLTEKEKERRRLLQLDVIEERARPPATESRCRIRKPALTAAATPDEAAAALVEVPLPPQTTHDLRARLPRHPHTRTLRVTIHHGTHLAAETDDSLSVLVRCGAFEGQTARVRRGPGTRTTWDELFEFPYPGSASVEVVLVNHTTTRADSRRLDGAAAAAAAEDEVVACGGGAEEEDGDDDDGREVGGVVVPTAHLHDSRRGEEVSVPVMPMEHLHECGYEDIANGPLGNIWMSWRLVRAGSAAEEAGDGAAEGRLGHPILCNFVVRRLFQYTDADESAPYPDGVLCVLRDTDDNCSESVPYTVLTAPTAPTLSPYYAQEGHHYVPLTASAAMQLSTTRRMGHILVCVPKENRAAMRTTATAEAAVAEEEEEEEELLVLAAVPIDLERMYHKGRAVLLIESKSKEEAVWGELEVEWANHVPDAGRAAPLPLEVPAESLFVTVVRGVNLRRVGARGTAAEMGTAEQDDGEETRGLVHPPRRWCTTAVRVAVSTGEWEGSTGEEGEEEEQQQQQRRVDSRTGRSGAAAAAADDDSADEPPLGQTSRRVIDWNQEIRFVGVAAHATALELSVQQRGDVVAMGQVVLDQDGDEGVVVVRVHDVVDDAVDCGEVVLSYRRIHPPWRLGEADAGRTGEGTVGGVDGTVGAVLRRRARRESDEEDEEEEEEEEEACEEEEEAEEREEWGAPPELRVSRVPIHPHPMEAIRRATPEEAERSRTRSASDSGGSREERNACRSKESETDDLTRREERNACRSSEDAETHRRRDQQDSPNHSSDAETHHKDSLSSVIRTDSGRTDTNHTYRSHEATNHDSIPSEMDRMHSDQIGATADEEDATQEAHAVESVSGAQPLLPASTAKTHSIHTTSPAEEAPSCARALGAKRAIASDAAEPTSHNVRSMTAVRTTEEKEMEEEEHHRLLLQQQQQREEAAAAKQKEMERVAAQREAADAVARAQRQREAAEHEAAEALARARAERAAAEEAHRQRVAAEEAAAEAAARATRQREAAEEEANRRAAAQRAAEEETEMRRHHERAAAEAVERERRVSDMAELEAAQRAAADTARCQREEAERAAAEAADAAQREREAADEARLRREDAERACAEALERARREREAADEARLQREDAERACAEALERARREREAAEKARRELEAAEKARMEREAAERARLEQEAAERARLEREAAEKARLELEAAERARLEQEAAERARLEREAAEKARLEREAAEKARLEREAAEKARLEREATERARLEREAAEKARLEREAAEKARLEREAAEQAHKERDELAAAAATQQGHPRRGARDMSKPPRSQKSAASSAKSGVPERYSRQGSSRGSLNNHSDSEGVRVDPSKTSHSGRRPSSRPVDWSAPPSYTSKFKKPFYPSGNPESETHLPFEKSALSKSNEESIRSLEQYHTRLVEESAQRERSPIRLPLSENILV